MSARLRQAFARARGENRAALVAYLTAYDGGRAHSLECLRAVADAGADVIELGVPFSDPTADGPAIQAAMGRALAAGATLVRVLELAAELRATCDVPIVLFGYCNPIVRLGADAFAASAAEHGADAVLVVDLPPESSAFVRAPVRAAGLDWIGLVAPTTTPERLGRIVAVTSGFLYAITLRGVTGAALGEGDVDAELRAQVDRIRVLSDLPIAAGFGVRGPAQARRLAWCDGVVVGSALVEAGVRGPAALAEDVRALREALVR
jgi:tryptophan synthase alpha chain